MGITVSQLETPFSDANSAALRDLGDRLLLTTSSLIIIITITIIIIIIVIIIITIIIFSVATWQRHVAHAGMDMIGARFRHVAFFIV